MHAVRRAAIVILWCALPAAARPSPAPRVVLRAGDVASDGLRLDSFLAPVAGPTGETAVQGTTSALLTRAGETVTVVARTGDPLPAPLTGTFNTFSGSAINDGGAIAFTATLNSSAADAGLFLFEGGTLTTIALSERRSDGTVAAPSGPDINNGSDVAYRTATAVRFWRRASGELIDVATAGDPLPGGGTFTRFRARPVLTDSASMAFIDDAGIFRWDTTSGIQPVARLGELGPLGTYVDHLGSRPAVAINERGQVAFTAAIDGAAAAGVFLHDPSSASTVVLARTGDMVGTSTLTGFEEEFVGVDSHGAVAFEGRFGERANSPRPLILAAGGTLTLLDANVRRGARNFAPRLTERGRIVWVRGAVRAHGLGVVFNRTSDTPVGAGFDGDDPSINNLDVTAFTVSRGGLYLLGTGEPRAVVRTGDTITDFGVVSTIRSYALGRRTLVFAAADVDGNVGIAVAEAAGSRKILSTGAPSPRGGTLDLDTPALAVVGRTVVFASSVTGGTVGSGLFRARLRAGKIDTLLQMGDEAPRGVHFSGFSSPVAGDPGVVFQAGLDNGDAGVFRLVRPHAASTIVGVGDTAPESGGGLFATFGSVAASRGRVLFAAAITGGSIRSGLFLWREGRITKVAGEGESAPGGGIMGSIVVDDLFPIALRGRIAAFLPRVVLGDPLAPLEVGRLFARPKATPHLLLGEGDTSPLGGTISVLSPSGIALADGSVVFAASLTGAEAAAALFARRVR